MDLTVTVGDVDLPASWTGSNPRTRETIAAALPLGGPAARWGDELYVRTDVDVPPEDARTAVAVGAVAFWPGGNAVCLFWGPTPRSEEGEPRAASPVNVFARVEDVSPLRELAGDATLRLS